MRDVSERFVAAAAGSNKPVVTANVWRGAELLREGVEVAGGQVEFSASRAVEGHAGVVIVDPDPGAAPVDAFGCVVNILAGFDVAESEPEQVSLGWFEITDCTVQENWSWPRWQESGVNTGRVLSLQGVDRMSVLAVSDFLTPMQPTAGADAWQTIQDICAGIVSTLDPGFDPVVIPATGLVFSWSRLEAVQLVAGLFDAVPIITADGQLTLMREDAGPTGELLGAQINIGQWERESSSRGVVNGVVFTGRSPEGDELTGYATEKTGPLAWGGAFGMRPTRRHSDLMDTQQKVDAAAQTHLATLIARRSTRQVVSALWNPMWELRDRPTFRVPGTEVEARVDGYTLPLLGGDMSVTLGLPWRLS